MNIALDIHIEEKRYGDRTILCDIRLQLQEGEVVSLIGTSGCGKSSLLSIASGLDRDFRGQVRLHGQPQQGVSRDIGFIFQEPRLFPWLTVAENIAFNSGDNAEAQRLTTRLLAKVGLHHHADALPRQLSGGQAQRAAIARGLFQIAHEHRLTVLLVTHDIDEALFLSDRIVLLDGAALPALKEFHPGPRPRKRSDSDAAQLKAAILESFM